MATFRSNRLTCVLVSSKDRMDRPVVQAIQFGHRLVGHVRAQFVHLQDKALCLKRVASDTRDQVPSHMTKKSNFNVQNKKQSFGYERRRHLLCRRCFISNAKPVMGGVFFILFENVFQIDL